MNQSEIPHDGVSQGMLLALLHAPAPDQTPQQQITAEPTPTDGVSALSAESGHRAQDLVTPMIVQVPTVDDPAPTLPSNVLHPTAEESSVLSGEQSARLTGDPRLPVNRQAPSPDEPRQEQIQPTQGPNIPVSQAGDKETPVVVPEHDAQRQPGTVTANGLSQSHRQTMEADNAARLVRQVTGADVQNVRDRQPAPPKQEIAVPKESVEEEERDTSGTVLPHGWKEFSDGDFGSDLLLSQKDDGPHERDERLLSQSTMPLDSPANHSAVAAAFAAGHSDQTTPRPVNSNAMPMTPGQPVTAPHDGTEPVIPLPSRSVVFEVAQPDLGRIHVRVAMTNDLVHTHLSSDRSDVGQFLMNGQDRLQAALQASGLDMGQFRVDIDRQSAGRSFQQGPPQEQGRGWHQNQARSEHNHGPDSHDGKHTASRGMLNLVA